MSNAGMRKTPRRKRIRAAYGIVLLITFIMVYLKIRALDEVTEGLQARMVNSQSEIANNDKASRGQLQRAESELSNELMKLKMFVKDIDTALGARMTGIESKGVAIDTELGGASRKIKEHYKELKNVNLTVNARIDDMRSRQQRLLKVVVEMKEASNNNIKILLKKVMEVGRK